MVQARSLASVVELADDPPQYSYLPTSVPLQERLVLYIARVPGSRGKGFSRGQ